jgi:hypothetical protein
MMENKIWKEIEGYEGLYRISHIGEVFSIEKKQNSQTCRS